MQVATLFRESANLLGASSMDSSQSHQQMQQQQQMESQQSIGSHFNHHMHHYKMSYSSPSLNGILNNAAINRSGIMVKQEALDDGYETSPDLEIRSTDSNQHYHMPLTPHTPQTPHTPRTPLTPISATPHQPQQPCSSATTLSQVSVKCEAQADPYSFVDDEITMSGVRATSSPNDNFNVIACDAQISLSTSLRAPPNHICTSQQQQQQQQINLKMINNAASAIHGVHQPKKRGRKKKCEMILTPEEAELAEAKKRAKTYKERKKHDRFDGMPEEEVSKRQLPDHLTNNLDIIIIGINPGLFAAYKGHHYAGPGNHFCVPALLYSG